MRNMLLLFLIGLCSCSIATEKSSQCIEYNEALKSIETMEKNAIEKILYSLNCYDGGDLSDVYIELGKKASAKPEYISKIISEADIYEEQATSIFSSLSFDYVDEPCKSQKEIKKRIEIIQSFYPDKPWNAYVKESLKERYLSEKNQCEKIEK